MNNALKLSCVCLIDFRMCILYGRKIKNAISGSFYVHKNKPDFCELFIIYGGKQFSIRGENDKGIMEDEKGVMVAKLRDNKGSFKDWLGKIFVPSPAMISLEKTPKPRRNILSSSSSINLESPSIQNQWEIYAQEVEEYFQHLLSLNNSDEDQSSQKSSIVELASPDLLADLNLVS